MSKFWLYEDMLSKDMGYRLFGIEHIAIIVLVIFSIIISVYLYNRLSNRDKIKHMLGIASICLISAPSGARFLRVKVPNPPGSGKDIAEGKGVEGDLESEGSWM